MSVYSTLSNDAGVTALTTSIFIGQAPQNTTAPYIVIDTIFINPANLLSERTGIDNNRISVDCYGDTQQNSISIYEACRTALELGVMVSNVNIYGLRDPDIDIFRTQFDVSEWANR